MAAATPLRFLRGGSRGFTPRGLEPTAAAATALAIGSRRAISSTNPRRASGDGNDGSGKAAKLAPYKALPEDLDLHMSSGKIRTLHDAVMMATTAEEREAAGYNEDRAKEYTGPVEKYRRSASSFTRAYTAFKPRRNDFWNQGETDPDLLVNEDGSDEFNEDDMLPMGHAKLEEHREMREYARLAIWEMPLLSELAKKFEPPTKEPLRWRYTSYMGEWHPAEKKVVVEFCPYDLGLTPVQNRKLAKLAGPRYNPQKRTIKMSCETYEHPAQNKRYLSDLVAKLIAEAKDPKDTFEDIPLDTRHYTFKTKPQFPKEWRITKERMEQLTEIREQLYQRDSTKKQAGELIDGTVKIQEALAPPPVDEADKALDDKLAELVAVKVSRGKTPDARLQ